MALCVRGSQIAREENADVKTIEGRTEQSTTGEKVGKGAGVSLHRY